MELTVKFVDYGNEISVSKVYPRCGRSVASAVWSQRDQQRKKLLSDSTDVGGMLFKASSRRSMFVVRWPVASKRSNSLTRCLSLFSFMGVTLSISITLMAASSFWARDEGNETAAVHPLALHPLAQTETSCRLLLH